MFVLTEAKPCRSSDACRWECVHYALVATKNSIRALDLHRSGSSASKSHDRDVPRMAFKVSKSPNSLRSVSDASLYRTKETNEDDRRSAEYGQDGAQSLAIISCVCVTFTRKSRLGPDSGT